MSEHVIQVVAEFGELNMKFVCNAVAGSPCKRRPANQDLDEWPHDYEGEMIENAECWAAEWVSAGGWESIMPDVDGIYASIPVTVDYDDGVIVRPVEPVKIPGDSAQQEAYKAGYIAAGIAALIGALDVAKVRVEEASDDE